MKALKILLYFAINNSEYLLHSYCVLDTEPSASHPISQYSTEGQILSLFTANNFTSTGDRIEQ